MKHLTKKQLIEAIEASLGNKSAMQKMLNIRSHNTLNKYLNRWNLNELLEEQTHKVNDKAIHNVTKWINEGDKQATYWWLERRVHHLFGNKNYNHNINENKDNETMTDEEIKAEIERIKK